AGDGSRRTDWQSVPFPRTDWQSVLRLPPRSPKYFGGAAMQLSINLQQRSLQPEIMDQPGLDEGRHVQALRGLERINFWSGSARILWAPIVRLVRQTGRSSLRLLDIAAGAGDVPIRLWRKARRAGL